LSGNRARAGISGACPQERPGTHGVMESTAGGAFASELSEARLARARPAHSRGGRERSSRGRGCAHPLLTLACSPSLTLRRKRGREGWGWQGQGRIGRLGLIALGRGGRRGGIAPSTCNFATLPQFIAGDRVASPISSGMRLLFAGMFTRNASANAGEAAAGGCWSCTILRVIAAGGGGVAGVVNEACT
jgi:hypothetical protein